MAGCNINSYKHVSGCEKSIHLAPNQRMKLIKIQNKASNGKLGLILRGCYHMTMKHGALLSLKKTLDSKVP